MSTSYILANVVVLPMTAFFTERFGRRNYLTFSILLFIIASFLCGTSHSLSELVIWRLLAGRGRRSAALDRAGDAAADLPARAAGHGAGHLPPRHHRRADARSHTRWMDHRQLHVELVLLHQHPHRHPLDLSRHDVPPRSRGRASHRSGGLARHRAAHRRHRLAAVRARGRESQRLVRRCSHPATLDRFGDLPDHDGLVGAVVAQQASGHQLPRAAQSRSIGVDLSLRRARLRPLRRDISLPAVHAGNSRIHADRDRAHDATRRARDRRDGRGLRPPSHREDAAGRRTHISSSRVLAPSASRCGFSDISRRWRAKAMRALR